MTYIPVTTEPIELQTTTLTKVKRRMSLEDRLFTKAIVHEFPDLPSTYAGTKRPTATAWSCKNMVAVAYEGDNGNIDLINAGSNKLVTQWSSGHRVNRVIQMAFNPQSTILAVITESAVLYLLHLYYEADGALRFKCGLFTYTDMYSIMDISWNQLGNKLYYVGMHVNRTEYSRIMCCNMEASGVVEKFGHVIPVDSKFGKIQSICYIPERDDGGGEFGSLLILTTTIICIVSERDFASCRLAFLPTVYECMDELPNNYQRWELRFGSAAWNPVQNCAAVATPHGLYMWYPLNEMGNRWHKDMETRGRPSSSLYLTPHVDASWIPHVSKFYVRVAWAPDFSMLALSHCHGEQWYDIDVLIVKGDFSLEGRKQYEHLSSMTGLGRHRFPEGNVWCFTFNPCPSIPAVNELVFCINNDIKRWAFGRSKPRMLSSDLLVF